LIFSQGLYELFIGELGLPQWMIIPHDLLTLKQAGKHVVAGYAVNSWKKWSNGRMPLTLVLCCHCAGFPTLIAVWLPWGET